MEQVIMVESKRNITRGEKILIISITSALLVFLFAIFVLFITNLNIISIADEIRNLLRYYFQFVYFLLVTISLFILAYKFKDVYKWYKRLHLHYKSAVVGGFLGFILILLNLSKPLFRMSLSENELVLERALWCLCLLLGLYWILSKCMSGWLNMKKNQTLALKIFIVSASPIVYLFSDTFSSLIINDIFHVSSNFFPRTEKFIIIIWASLLINVALNLLILGYIMYLFVKSIVSHRNSYAWNIASVDMILAVLVIAPLYTVSSWIDKKQSSYTIDFALLADFENKNHCLFDGERKPAILIDAKNYYALVPVDDTKGKSFKVLKCQFDYIK